MSFWKYPVVIYYICHRNNERFEGKFGAFLNKLVLELFTKYLILPTVNAVKTDILKLNAAIVKSDKPIFDFKEIDLALLEKHIQNPHRNLV